jgi:hypothetical protein
MATVRDLDALALELPGVTKDVSEDGRPSYSVNGKAFCFHRPPRKDAPFDDVLVFRTESAETKALLLADPRGIFFTTPHWDGYTAVLMHIPDLKQLRKRELRDLVEDAWLTRAPAKLAKTLLPAE